MSTFANSEDPDEMQHNASLILRSDGLHFLIQIYSILAVYFKSAAVGIRPWTLSLTDDVKWICQ